MTDRILIIANAVPDSDDLAQAIHRRARRFADPQVHVVAPALNTRLRFWTSDEDGARREARVRLLRCLEHLSDHGIAVAGGEVGDPDPLLAVADARELYEPTTVLVLTPPAERCNWLARDLAERAQQRFGLEAGEVVVQPDEPYRSEVRTLSTAA